VRAPNRRFWRDLGSRIEGDPAALTRMPADIAEIADGMWRRALKLAGETAAHDDNAARERRLEIGDASSVGLVRGLLAAPSARARGRHPAPIL